MNQSLHFIANLFESLFRKITRIFLFLLTKIYGKAFIFRHTHNVSTAIEAIKANKLKSILTGLGIIFGVAAVISMLAIGRGAKHEILEQMKYVGVNNIIINTLDPNISDDNKFRNNSKFYKGLTISDIASIKEVISSVKSITPVIIYNTNAIHITFQTPVRLMGVSDSYFEIFNLKMLKGKQFNSFQENYGLPVCLISSKLKRKLFKNTDPINQYLKCGKVWLEIIGIYESRNLSSSGIENIKIDFEDDNVYIPVKTMLFKFINRSILKPGFRKNVLSTTNNLNSGLQQLDKIIVQVKESEQMISTAEVLSQMLLRRHYGIKDFEIVIPELLLKQQQKTKDIFNFVLGTIAAISLLVGGIGIMNIMYASVLERTREIGTRMAVGATRNDIGVQFLAESVLISFTGGIIGVFLGIIISKFIMLISGILTIVSIISIIIAFIISVTIGIAFGYVPAREAALKNPIDTLRYE